MAFIIAPKTELNTTVEVIRRGDYGKQETSDFVLRFKKLTVEELKPLREKGKGEQAFSDEVFKTIEKNIMGWEGVFADAEKTKSVDFNAENLVSLLNETETRRAVFFAFWDVQNGAIEKNS